MNHRLWLALPLTLLVSTLLLWPAAEVAAEPADRYQVPDGDVAELVKYIQGLQEYQPTKADEILAYREKAVGAFRTAANRILKLEKDSSSDAYRLAKSLTFQLGLNQVAYSTPEEQRDFYQQLKDFVAAAKPVARLDVALANTFCQILLESKNTELAKDAYAHFGKQFAELEEEALSQHGERMIGTSRRLDLVGKPFHIEGETVSGDQFDWKAYRGKVVLVDYWATWCGPCVAQLPALKEQYAKYHDQGFEIVGISLDEERGRLQRFLNEREVPWTQLFEPGSGWNHPMVLYYGINATPTTILVDREGQVIAMNLHGGELERQLAKLFGPTNEVNSGE